MEFIDISYNLIRFLIKGPVYILWKGKIQGIDKVPQSGPFILAANHSSYLDFIVLFALINRRLTFLAAEKFFCSPLWKPIMKFTGQIRVDRKSEDKTKVFEKVDKIFSENRVLAIFPEGTRSRSGQLGQAYDGAVRFAKKYHAPIIPVGIINAFNAWPPQKKIPKIFKVDVKIGTPYYIETDDSKETRKLMKKIAELSNQQYIF